jgi:hypothetical protein
MSRTGTQPDGAQPFPADHEEPEDELIMHLEHDQLVAETLRPLPRAHVGPRALFGLWVLRIFVVMVSAMVIYTFISRLQ